MSETYKYLDECELKPCPFCGYIGVEFTCEQDMNKFYGSCECRLCGVTVHGEMRRCVIEAVNATKTAWNTRVHESGFREIKEQK